MTDTELTARVRGALWGTACGDAFGMPNSFLKVLPWRDAMEPGPDNSPYHAGYAAGRITDDTEQALALTTAMLDGFTRKSVARRLHEWFVSVGGASSLAVGPSTMRAMLAYGDGTPVEELGKTGVTNGAAMRIAPVGVVAALAGGDFDHLLDLVETACAPTHDTSPANSGSAAIAAAIMVGVGGGTLSDVIDASIEGARRGAERGCWIYAPDIDERIRLALATVEGLGTAGEVADRVSRVVGTGEPCTQSVPAAIAFAAWAKGDPEKAILVAGNSRGDTDTTAAMAGAICGALSGEAAIPEDWRRIVSACNDLDVADWADRLHRTAVILTNR